MERCTQEFTAFATKFEKDIPGLMANLKRMVALLNFDGEMAVARARIVCESIVKDIYQKEIGDPGKKALHDLIVCLRKPSLEAKRIPIPRKVYTAMGNIRELANLTVHSVNDTETINESDINSAMWSCHRLVEWYISDYRKMSPLVSPPPPPPPLDELPYFLWDAFLELSVRDLRYLCEEITGETWQSKEENLVEIVAYSDSLEEILQQLSLQNLKILAKYLDISPRRSMTEQIDEILKWSKNARIKQRGVSMVYLPALMKDTFLHFSWREESCRLRSYTNPHNYEEVSHYYETVDVLPLIEREVEISGRKNIDDIEFWHEKTLELNKTLFLET